MKFRNANILAFSCKNKVNFFLIALNILQVHKIMKYSIGLYTIRQPLQNNFKILLKMYYAIFTIMQ